MEELGYPFWVRLTHFFNILFLSLLARSGIEILGGHPMLYWNDHCTPGSEWLRFTGKKMPKDRPWTAEDEKEPYSPWIALPGRDHLGIGRYWHFSAAIGWLLTGLLYVTIFAFTPQWQRLVPTSWDIFPRALETALVYLRLEIPHAEGLFNPLQKLAYASVVLILAPLQILTGIAMSPAVAGRFPGYTKLFGGRQSARSLHFIGLVAFGAFTVHHTAIVIVHGFGRGMARVVLGVMDATPAQELRAIWIGLAGLAAIIGIHAWATRASLHAPRRVQHRLQRIVDPVRNRLLGGLQSRQRFDRARITDRPRANGRPPRNAEYGTLLSADFADWRFEVGGMVDVPLALTLDELRSLPRSDQVTRHCCIQGWSYMALWEGIPVEALLERCRPRPEARYLLFETFDEKWENEGHGLGYFYSVIDREQARRPQTILAYDMNGRPLPLEFGAPLRLRVESQLGFKMAKWVRRLELIDDYRAIGRGQGNWRADYLYYSFNAPI